MNRPLLRLALALVFPAVACADYSFDAAVRYGSVDTGISTKSIASPEISVRKDFGESGVYSIGLAYVFFKWSDRHFTSEEIPGTTARGTTDRSGSVRWNVFFLDYRYSIPLSKSWSLVLSPRLGAARGSESGTAAHTGEAMADYVEHYSADSAWRFAAEAQACMKCQICEGWHSQFGVALTRLPNGHSNLPLAKSISSIQGVLGISHSF
jgi:hypothetical protein